MNKKLSIKNHINKKVKVFFKITFYWDKNYQQNISNRNKLKKIKKKITKINRNFSNNNWIIKMKFMKIKFKLFNNC